METRIRRASESRTTIPILLKINRPDRFKTGEFFDEEVKYRTDEVYRMIHALLLSGPQYYYSCSIDDWNADFLSSLKMDYVATGNANWVVCLSVPKRFSIILEYWATLKLFGLKETDADTPQTIKNLDKRLSNNRKAYKKKWDIFRKEHPALFK